jgi:hypothetical protein
MDEPRAVRKLLDADFTAAVMANHIVLMTVLKIPAVKIQTLPHRERLMAERTLPVVFYF